MTKTIQCWVLIIALLAAFVPGLAGQAETSKIKVTAVDAVIYDKPNVQGQALDRPAQGAWLEIVRRSGEWFEVKIASKLGIALTGFIHQSAVEIPSAPAAPVEVTVAGKPAPRTVLPARRKLVQIGIGGFVSKTKAGATREDGISYRDETMTIEDTLTDASLVGFDFRIGVMPISFLEVETAFQMASKTLTGSYRLGVPSPYYYHDFAYADDTESIPFKIQVFSLGVVFHPLRRGPVRPYLGLGLAICNASLKVLKDVSFAESIYSDYSHTVDIRSVELENVKATAVGFQGRLGLDAAIHRSLFLFLEGVYVAAKKDIKLPLASTIEGSGVTRSLDLGGLRACFGLKVRI
ncbi:MAG: hypothetical protein PHI34_05670 [Acidobacteriota bacterium]|nr:hypothetical protein [Acidobacteriota bacterium]